jgi:hypothetical protein
MYSEACSFPQYFVQQVFKEFHRDLFLGIFGVEEIDTINSCEYVFFHICELLELIFFELVGPLLGGSHFGRLFIGGGRAGHYAR